MPVVFAVIGDLVGSRTLSSRPAAQDSLTAALRRTSLLVTPVDTLEPTVGDEFQGVYATFAHACAASLIIRLELLAADQAADARFGIGAGTREVLTASRTPMLQDGPAWWSARAALKTLETPAGRPRRTWYDGCHARGTGPQADLVNAFLLTRDALVDRLNPRARLMLLLALSGLNQRAIAERLQISESAVSQAFAKGVGAVRDAQAMLADHPPSP